MLAVALLPIILLSANVLAISASHNALQDRALNPAHGKLIKRLPSFNEARADSSEHNNVKKSPSSDGAATESSSSKAITERASSRPKPKYSSSKVGLAWGADWDRLSNFAVKGAPVYNWTPNPPPANQNGMEAIPMLWGKKNLDGSCHQKDRCWSKIKKNGQYKTIMGFNEPNQAGQSDMSWQEGVSLWKQHIEPLATGKGAMRTISPATTSAPSGLVWMKNFVKGCTGCHIDVIALHWYDVDADAFIRYVESFHKAFPTHPIWVTEFACQNMNHGAQCSQSKANAFMRKVTDWMDSQSYVERYFAFGIQHLAGVQPVNQLMNLKTGKPSYQGRLFLGWSS